MTLEEIEAKLQSIREVAGDDEKAHCEEDDLYFDFIKFIASLDSPLAALAKKVLEVQDIEFNRWHA